MSTLLVIHVSPRQGESISRTLTARFVERWHESNPDGEVVIRDLARTDVSHLDAAWVNATFVPAGDRTPPMQEVLMESDVLTAELLSADEIVIGTPMYNFAAPAVLKAWVDQVVRAGVTFTLKGGMLADRPVTLIVSSREEFSPGSTLEPHDYLSPYLKYVFRFMGVTDFRVVQAGDYFSLRTGKITRAEHLARYLPQVEATAGRVRIDSGGVN